MEFYEVIEKRSNIREFEDRPISREVLERILTAGLKAPSSNHQRQWELLTLTDKEIILSVATIVKPYYCRITEPKTFRHEKRGASESAASRGGLQLLMSKVNSLHGIEIFIQKQFSFLLQIYTIIKHN